MDVKNFVDILGCDFFTGVPDSRLKALCDYLMNTYGTDPKHHIITANEGNAAALGAGYYSSSGKVPVIYMQNSGLGNIVNPVTSLLNSKVYDIPEIFIIGWRGEPGVHDEPQHIFQGEITLRLLDDLQIKYLVISKDTGLDEIKTFMQDDYKLKAFVIRKGALCYDKKVSYQNNYFMTREEIIRHVISFSGENPVISTTGKTSRELFELRETHERDFLTVGSMGHASSIALGVALNHSGSKVWCIDGDGAALMHMGTLAIIGSVRPSNLIHIVINNASHESVGGLPTSAGKINLSDIAKSCGYEAVFRVKDYDSLDIALVAARDKNALTFIEAEAKIFSRDNLGRPTTTAQDNKNAFMNFINS